MKRATRLSAVILGAILFMAGPALAVKPGEDVNPNGFPNGDHYNLNIIGKKDGFNCPEQEVDEDGNSVNRSNWNQNNTTVHDCYIHDIGGEGLYLGSSYWKDKISPELDSVHKTVVIEGERPDIKATKTHSASNAPMVNNAPSVLITEYKPAVQKVQKVFDEKTKVFVNPAESDDFVEDFTKPEEEEFEVYDPTKQPSLVDRDASASVEDL